jgi:prophage regulatory protein
MTKIPLMAIGEIRARLGGISETRARQIADRETFPVPVWELATGRVWLASEVEEWIRQYREGHRGTRRRRRAAAGLAHGSTLTRFGPSRP